jgi:predicted nucleotidyltransferase
MCLMLQIISQLQNPFVVNFYLFGSALFNDLESHVDLLIGLHNLVLFAKNYFQLRKKTFWVGLHELFTPFQNCIS